MNYKKLFAEQGKLDQHIEEKHHLIPKDLFHDRQLALLVELGEAFNEARFFKFWSVDKEPREAVKEELADCLHFLLSLGLMVGANSKHATFYRVKHPVWDKTKISIDFINAVSSLDTRASSVVRDWWSLMYMFVGIAELLGVSEAELEEQYFAKNKVNHKRQDNNY